ncbi:MAG: TonB-dependent receptor [Bacteroidota bacterium]
MKVFFTYLFLAIPFWVFSQDKLTGKVYDVQTKDALVGASIFNKNGVLHTHSNAFGDFTLDDISKGDTILVTYLGYTPFEFRVEDDLQGFRIAMVPSSLQLDQITITSDIDLIKTIANADIKLNPISSSQDILRKVPGLFIAQHAGGGKAEQIFLRGFDIDHGTDIQITADGMPVNMVSHAHGQGYADLHFLIPETIEKVDFGKGPYYANKGNFTTAGYVDFQTYDKIDQSSIKLEGGRFNTARLMGMIDLVKDAKEGGTDAYLATEYLATDGPFDASQNFERFNLFGKMTTQLNEKNALKLQASTFTSRWDASGQIPDRTVESGQISRFGAIDSTEGGQTSRTNLSFTHQAVLGERDYIESQFFYSNYSFELYSNFTFFLNDSINGDQIRQKESRNIYGFSSDYTRMLDSKVGELSLRAGAGFRFDNVRGNELSRSLNRRETLSRLALGDVNEANAFAYSGLEWEIGKWFISPGVRVDHFRMQYYDQLQTLYSNRGEQSTFVSPKLNLVYSPNTEMQVYLKSGRGFHSNDTRVVVAQGGRDILPAAYGFDWGVILKPVPNLYLNVAYWYLFLEQEFVYVGDEAVVEPSGRSQRTGIDASLTYQLTDNIFLDAALNFADPRALDEEDGEDFIPLAPTLTSVGGISYASQQGFSGSLRYRYVKDRAANEDNSVIAEGYFITDLNLNYDWENFGIYVSIENLFNEEWREAQFDTESLLRNESEPVSEIHYTPGTPFFIRTGVAFKF